MKREEVIALLEHAARELNASFKAETGQGHTSHPLSDQIALKVRETALGEKPTSKLHCLYSFALPPIASPTHYSIQLYPGCIELIQTTKDQGAVCLRITGDNLKVQDDWSWGY